MRLRIGGTEGTFSNFGFHRARGKRRTKRPVRQRYRGEDKRRQVASKAFTYLNSVFQRPIYLRGTKNAGDDLIGKSCSTIKPEVESRTVSMQRNEPATRFTTNHGCPNSRRNFSRVSVFKSMNRNDSVSNLDVKMIDLDFSQDYRKDDLSKIIYISIIHFRLYLIKLCLNSSRIGI